MRYIRVVILSSPFTCEDFRHTGGKHEKVVSLGKVIVFEYLFNLNSMRAAFFQSIPDELQGDSSSSQHNVVWTGVGYRRY